MEHRKKLHRYSVTEINGALDALRREYDLVRLVDVEECRVVEVDGDGAVRYLRECHQIWGRSARCENCTSYRACHTHCTVDKKEYLGSDIEEIHSVPIELVLRTGEVKSFVIECVRCAGRDEEGAARAAAAERKNDRTRDVLTRLYNPEMLSREIRKKLLDDPETDYVIALVNVRDFKLVNQLFGIEGGNLLLVGISDALRDICGADCVYGRYRDDRFAVLVSADRFDAAAFTERVQRCAREQIESPIFDAKVKVGVYEITERDAPVSVMMEHAELAADSVRDDMKCAYAVFEPDMLKRKLHDILVIEDFEKAILNGEFHVHLQPQVTGDGRIIGAEALVRWIRGDEVIMPGEFLPVLARSELLSHLDVYVWKQTAAILSRWSGTELENIPISVNVDPADFYYLDVPTRLCELCDRCGIRRGSLRVELTEASLIKDAERESMIMQRLREAGFYVEIDDFGKGSSSLSLLKDVHADMLKIDMGFLQGEANVDRSHVILGSVITMAQGLGMDVLTEGVETAAQVEMLTELGCNCFQGYFFSRPIPVQDFETLAKASLAKK